MIYSPQKPEESSPGYPTSKDIIGSIGSNVFQNNGKKFNNTNKHSPPPFSRKPIVIQVSKVDRIFFFIKKLKK
jgi:hypothetical protein